MNLKLYYNGTIITMEKEGDCPYAVLVEGERIKSILTQEETNKVETHYGEELEKIDLNGHTLIPSFMDSHSHITGLANSLRFVSLSNAVSFDEIITLLKNSREERNLTHGEWLVGFGYDNNKLIEKVHPTKNLLDKAFSQNPVIISHVSGHMGVINSLALKEANINSDTVIEGGVIGIEDGEPSGYLEEKAFMNLSTITPGATVEEMLCLLKKAQDIYLSNGITTIQDGYVKADEFKILNQAAKNHMLKADVVGFVDIKNSASIYQENKEYHQYINGFKLGGYKMFLDGSPQGKTAWLTKPYLGEDSHYYGYPIYKDEEVKAMIKTALTENTQLLTHCNGDAAAKQYLDSFEDVAAKFHIVDNKRPVMIHAQLLRRDQLVAVKNLHMIPSFFIAHTYYWGDIHRINLGRERGDYISPAKSAKNHNIPFTLHQDTPVIMPNMMETIWCAVNRITKNGEKLATEECLTPYEALQGVTINAAYQYFEEKEKGSLAVGKLADMVILESNPLTVESDKIKDIKVLETIKSGITVYRL